MNPKVSVVMASYNNSKYIAETIESILNQTYKNFELIIVDDCSTDNSQEVVKSFNDKRIKLIVLDENSGPGKARNVGIKEAKAELVAIIDSDDIALPYRLEKQVEFMEKNPHIGVSSSWIKIKMINDEKILKPPQGSGRIKFESIFYPGIVNPAAIVRKSVLVENNIFYNEEFRQAQDYDLWAKLCFVTNFANIPEVFLLYRKHDSNISVISKDKQIENANKIRKEQLKRFGLNPTEEELDLHINLIFHNKVLNNQELKKLMEWSLRLYNWALNTKICDEDYVVSRIGFLLPFFYKRCEDLSVQTIEVYKQSPFYKIINDDSFKKYLDSL